MMELWILRLINDDSASWSPWYDKAFGHIVRATTEQQARQFAADACGDEGKHAWIDDMQSSCVLLSTDGPDGVVMTDFHAA